MTSSDRHRFRRRIKMAVDVTWCRPSSSCWTIVSFIMVLWCSAGCSAQAPDPCSFSDGQYAVVLRVREDLPLNAEIATLNIKGSKTEIKLTLEETKDSKNISFNPDTRELKVKKLLDADKTVQSMSIKIVCEKSGGQKTNLMVLISLIDINEYAPKFEKDVYKLDIGELTPIGTTLLTSISAVDHDTTNINVMYSIEPGLQAEYFNMPMPGKGILQLVKSLDYEDFHNMSVLITATDKHPGANSSEHKTGTATLQIRVKDGDDKNPVEVDGPFTGTILANEPVDTPVKMTKPIKARDGDSGLNVPINYRLLDFSGVPGFFSIDKQSGELKLARSGPPTGKNVVVVEAYQTDKPKMRSHAFTVLVTVQGTNVVPPTFGASSYTAKIVENTPPGTSVLTVSAADKDQGSILKYGLEGTSRFTVGEKDGVISLKDGLDYEKETKHEFKATVFDGTYSSTATVIVNVLDVNDHDPVFSEKQYTFRYGEDQKDDLLGKVVVTDADRDSKVTLTLRGYTDIFSLNEAGELRLIAKQNKIASTQYRVLIDATDNGTPSRSSTGDVMVIFPAAKVGAVVDKRSDTDLIPLIILACLCALLLIVIIGLIIYIHKRRSWNCKSDPFIVDPADKDKKEFNPAYEPYPDYTTSESGLTTVPEETETSYTSYTTQEQTLDFSDGYTTQEQMMEFSDDAISNKSSSTVVPKSETPSVAPSTPTSDHGPDKVVSGHVVTEKPEPDPEGEAEDKQRRSNKENNLMYYSNTSTMTLNEEDGATTIQENPLAVTNPGYYTLENGIPRESRDYGSERQVSEIQLDSAVTPIRHNNNGSIKSNGSTSSYGDPHRNGMSTFMNGPGKKPKKLNWNEKNRVEVFNAENAIDPTPDYDHPHVDGEKPDITVYF